MVSLDLVTNLEFLGFFFFFVMLLMDLFHFWHRTKKNNFRIEKRDFRQATLSGDTPFLH